MAREHIKRAIEKAGGLTDFATAIGVSPQAANNFRSRGWLPLERARIASNIYGIALGDLVKADIAAALNDRS